MYEITKEFMFSAAHRLDQLPTDHQCFRAHGHNYVVTVALTAVELDKNGFVVDYADLDDTMGKYIKNYLDHRDLNAVFFKNDWGFTTAENIAYRLFLIVKNWFSSQTEGRGLQVDWVMVKETDKTSATYLNPELY